MASFTASAAHAIGRVTEALEPLPPAPERTVRRMEPRLSATDQPRGQPERRRTTHLGELDFVIGQNWIESSRVASTAWETDNAPLLATDAGTVLWLRHNCSSCCWKPRRQFHAPPGARLGLFKASGKTVKLSVRFGLVVALKGAAPLAVSPSRCTNYPRLRGQSQYRRS